MILCPRMRLNGNWQIDSEHLLSPKGNITVKVLRVDYPNDRAWINVDGVDSSNGEIGDIEVPISVMQKYLVLDPDYKG